MTCKNEITVTLKFHHKVKIVFMSCNIIWVSWVQTVLLLPICSFIRKRHTCTSYRGFSRKHEKKLAWSFNFLFRYIDDALSLNSSRFGDFVDRISIYIYIYPIELEIKDTTDWDRPTSYLDLHLKIDSEGHFRTKLYDKRDDFLLSHCIPFYLYVATFQQ